MIRDLSLTLKSILSQSGLPPELAAAQIVFDRPSENFNPQQTTVDLFLYDIRENVELRNNEPIITRSNGQVTTHPSPLRVACSYLITAWPVGGPELPLQEHRLLGQVLQVLSRYPMIDASFLQGSLVGQEPPLPMVAMHPDALKNLSEFWTALGSRMRPSLTVTVTISMDVLMPEVAPMVITKEVRMGQRISPTEEKNIPSTQEELFSIGGIVTDSANSPVAGATVMLMERDLTTKTDTNGLYSLGMVSSGTYTLRVQPDAAAHQDFSITIPAPHGSNYNVKLV